MDDCSQNALCVSLPPEVRRRLCENCIKASYAQDTIMPIDTNHPIVIVEGIVLAVSSDKPLLLMAPGSLLLTPYFTPQKATPWLRSAQEVGEEIRQVRYRCITRAVFSTLTNKAVEALLEDREFLRTVFDNQLAQSDLITNYQRASITTLLTQPCVSSCSSHAITTSSGSPTPRLPCSPGATGPPSPRLWRNHACRTRTGGRPRVAVTLVDAEGGGSINHVEPLVEHGDFLALVLQGRGLPATSSAKPSLAS